MWGLCLVFLKPYYMFAWEAILIFLGQSKTLTTCSWFLHIQSAMFIGNFHGIQIFNYHMCVCTIQACELTFSFNLRFDFWCIVLTADGRDAEAGFLWASFLFILSFFFGRKFLFSFSTIKEAYILLLVLVVIIMASLAVEKQKHKERKISLTRN